MLKGRFLLWGKGNEGSLITFLMEDTLEVISQPGDIGTALEVPTPPIWKSSWIQLVAYQHHCGRGPSSHHLLSKEMRH